VAQQQQETTVVDAAALAARMRASFEQTMQEVAQAVNAAPDGQWIEASEDPVWQAMAAFRERAYQTAGQMRTDAAEASFSPSDR
jgi:cytochrome c556